MRNRVAVVLCVHHKPWLVMSTLITLALQDFQDFDLYVAFNVGDGSCTGKVSYEPYRGLLGEARDRPAHEIERESYERYGRLAREAGINPQLSPFDERVRAVCRVGWPRVSYLEFENDHALDSGVWYKVIRSGLWEKYDHVVFAQEGTLFTRPTALGAAFEFVRRADVDFLAAGHMKRRLSRAMFLRYNRRQPSPMPLDAFHDQMIDAVFKTFRRDPDFDAVFQGWPDDVAPRTEHHVPDVWGGWLWRRLRSAADSRAMLPENAVKRAGAAFLRRHRRAFVQLGLAAAVLRARAAQGLSMRWRVPGRGADDPIYVDNQRRRVGDLVSISDVAGVKFHHVHEPEWFGACCNHLFSRAFLDRLATRLEKYGLYDVLDLPFAGTALEVVWGLMPQWLGFDKWFFDGLHRVNKNCITSRREDEPPEIAEYINRYYPGRIAVRPRGDFLRIAAASEPWASRLRAVLDETYF